MPSQTLPTIPQRAIAESNTTEKCYITMGAKVYDMTDFLDSHPGGGDLILEYGGKDVEGILQDNGSHAHSEAAYEILKDALIGLVVTDAVMDPLPSSMYPARILPLQPTEKGVQQNGPANDVISNAYLRTGVATAEDFSKDTDPDDDYRTHKFLDLNKPLFLQILFGGFSKEFYLEQVHRPRHYKGGESAPIFGNFLEPLTKTPWWMIPLLWGPPVAYGTFISRDGCASWVQVAVYWGFGLFMWSLVEYGLHRCLFHLDYHLADNPVAITAHFLLHGVHHYLPMDKYRLVMPPTMFIILAFPFWMLAHAIFYWNWHVATAVFCGGVFGYIGYDLTHYFIHHCKLPSFYQDQKKYHLQHHFIDYENGFGITSRFWDRAFGTELTLSPSKVFKSI
ncbi:hypothetical protein OIDMADRAFT_137013 [Oidiodendron maius Zn]|uniref:Ceramide very long chain fatty acid hydroxylase n=1 Tax=Oidiodendron maius (strain Zn) TaxID=913774 RepID=A0A0C3C4P9_OIDMZ|nr:hypothetical protein OIDMADRAFT_137013 [Oidiodendron maius Zn]